jgi:hypothetical protein
MRICYRMDYALFPFSASDARNCVEESAMQSGAHFPLFLILPFFLFLAVAYEDVVVVTRYEAYHRTLIIG